MRKISQPEQVRDERSRLRRQLFSGAGLGALGDALGEFDQRLRAEFGLHSGQTQELQPAGVAERRRRKRAGGVALHHHLEDGMVRVEELGRAVKAAVVERNERQLAQTRHEARPLVSEQLRQLVVAYELHVRQGGVDRQVVEVGKYVLRVDFARLAKTTGTRNGITELPQRAPPIFDRAAITLGIGPHSSFFYLFFFFSFFLA